MSDYIFMELLRNNPGIRLRRAFTLIELLVVIAIISILVALLFPIFSSVLENSRESNSMSKMQQIQSALALYKLDNKHYPDVLFAYAPSGADSCAATDMTNIGSASGCSKELAGLYPAYISDWHVFTSPNNNIDDPAATVTLTVNTMNGRTMKPGAQISQNSYYKMDAFDISPQITGVNQIADPKSSNYIVRYQTSWTDYTPVAASGTSTPYSTLCFPDGASDSTGVCLSAPADTNIDPDYARQLRWTTPPPDTYVTATTDHIQNANRILVLYLDGTVKKVNFQDGWQNPVQGTSSTNAVGDSPATANYSAFEQSFNDSQADIGAIPVNSANGAVYESKAGFWRTLLGRGEH